MSLYFLDSSAFLKRYLREIGSAWIQQLYSTETIIVSALVIPELSSTLARLNREGRLSPTGTQATLRAFGADLMACSVIEVNRLVLDEAARLLLAVPPTIALRSLDAIHLASARHAVASLAPQPRSTLVLVSSDTRLLAAATWAGLAADNPEQHP